MLRVIWQTALEVFIGLGRFAEQASGTHPEAVLRTMLEMRVDQLLDRQQVESLTRLAKETAEREAQAEFGPER